MHQATNEPWQVQYFWLVCKLCEASMLLFELNIKELSCIVTMIPTIVWCFCFALCRCFSISHELYCVFLFQEWLSQKKNKEKLQKQKEKEEKERKEQEKEEFKKKCDQAYSDWLNKVSNRPKSAPQHTSFGYASGKLTGELCAIDYISQWKTNPGQKRSKICWF